MTGYIFKFNGHGCFDPNGLVGEMTDEQVKAHNAALASAEVQSMKAEGRAVLYRRDTRVGTWDGSVNFPVRHQRSSRHNMGGTRLDLWFTGPDGAAWHGVNIGDNDIVRCRRNKTS